MADGIAVGCPGDLPFALVQDVVDEVVTVSEAAISKALLLCLERAKQVVEPAGAAAVAAVLAEPRRWEPPMVARAHRRQHRPGAADAGGPARHARRRPLPVRPGPDRRPAGRAGPAARLVAELGANVVDVEHSRTTSHLDLGEVEVALSVETRGAEHRVELLAALGAAGHAVSLS